MNLETAIKQKLRTLSYKKIMSNNYRIVKGCTSLIAYEHFIYTLGNTIREKEKLNAAQFKEIEHLKGCLNECKTTKVRSILIILIF